MTHRGDRQSALFKKILSARRADFLVEQHAAVKSRRLQVHLQNPFARHTLSCQRFAVPCGQRNPRLFRKEFHSAAVIEFFDFHDERDDIAARAAAKAIKALRRRINRERRCAFAVEWAQSLFVCAGFAQRHVALNDRLNVTTRPDIFNHGGRNHFLHLIFYNMPILSLYVLSPAPTQTLGTNSSSYRSIAYLSVMPAI